MWLRLARTEFQYIGQGGRTIMVNSALPFAAELILLFSLSFLGGLISSFICTASLYLFFVRLSLRAVLDSTFFIIAYLTNFLAPILFFQQINGLENLATQRLACCIALAALLLTRLFRFVYERDCQGDLQPEA
jgi:hypothetical protein